jgi:hypothetical protein
MIAVPKCVWCNTTIADDNYYSYDSDDKLYHSSCLVERTLLRQSRLDTDTRFDAEPKLMKLIEESRNDSNKEADKYFRKEVNNIYDETKAREQAEWLEAFAKRYDYWASGNPQELK